MYIGIDMQSVSALPAKALRQEGPGGAFVARNLGLGGLPECIMTSILGVACVSGGFCQSFEHGMGYVAHAGTAIAN